MNHLAHSVLSNGDHEVLTGNFMADFLSPADIRAIQHQNILKGILLHKKIDHFTDNHPSVKDAISLIRPFQGKYAPVTLDILFDYFLIKNWEKYTSESLISFTRKVYEVLDNNSYHYPAALKTIVPRMIADDFLLSCKDEQRLIRTFERIKNRAKFDNTFDKAHTLLQSHHDQIDDHFISFFPDIIAYIQSQ
jgi:acyl carrier protein phosphodiesterase